MPPGSGTADPQPERFLRGRAALARHWRAPSLIGGGPDGNEQLTATTGLVLIALLAPIGVTIAFIGQLIWLHLFVGLLLIGPVVLKMASTGYRFALYYAGNSSYRGKGPPELALRVMAPAVVASTLVVFVTGIMLLIQGPRDRGQLVEIHKVSFIVWLVFTALHVLGHLQAMPGSLRAVRRLESSVIHDHGGPGRWIAIVTALAAGLVLAMVLIPDFAAWTARGAFPHHHHHG